MLATLHVVFSSEKDEDYLALKNKMYEIDSRFSISPFREYPMKKDCGEFNCIIHLEKNEIQDLLDKLNNDWDGEYDDCECYGFNTKMFDPLVYSLYFTCYE